MKKGTVALLKLAEKLEIKLAAQESDEEFQKDLDLLTQWKSDGTLKSLYQMMKDKTPVWIKRSSGAWQEALIHEIGFGGLGISVKWLEDGRSRGKVLNTKDFLMWQKEHP